MSEDYSFSISTGVIFIASISKPNFFLQFGHKPPCLCIVSKGDSSSKPTYSSWAQLLQYIR